MKPRTRSDIIRQIDCQPWAMAKEGDDMRPCMRHRIDPLWQGESVYKVIDLVGMSSASWEKAVTAAVSRASKTLRDLGVRQ